jgi:hypothetical protein
MILLLKEVVSCHIRIVSFAYFFDEHDLTSLYRFFSFLFFSLLFFSFLNLDADTASNRKMLNMLLNKRAVVNDMAINGIESVVAVRENFDKYDVIFMDYTMPEMVRR